MMKLTKSEVGSYYSFQSISSQPSNPSQSRSFFMNKVLSIVHIVPGLTKGGAERVVIDLVNSFSRQGHSISIIAICKFDKKLMPSSLSSSLKIIYINSSPQSRLSSYLRSFLWLYLNRKWLMRQDILHVHLTQSSILATLLFTYRRLYSLPSPVIIETYHAVGMCIPIWAQRLHAWNLQYRDGIALMAIDQFWTNFRNANHHIPIRLIPNGIESPSEPVVSSDVRNYLDSIGIPASAKLIIGTVGRLHPDRSPMKTALILSEILKALDDNSYVLMCGSGSEFTPIQQMVSKNGLSDHFILPGLCLHPHLAMASMSLYLAINVGKNTGIAALESVFSNVPVIAFQADPNYCFDENDWIPAFIEPDEVIAYALSLLNDPLSLQCLRDRQHRYALSHHTAEAMSKSYLDLYNSSVFNRRGAPSTTLIH